MFCILSVFSLKADHVVVLVAVEDNVIPVNVKYLNLVPINQNQILACQVQELPGLFVLDFRDRRSLCHSSSFYDGQSQIWKLNINVTNYVG